MKLSKKRFLTIFFSALFLILGVVGLFVYEYVRIRPNDVHFTNVTSSSVTVSWNTRKAIPASVRIFEGDRFIPFSIYHNGDRFFDTRDVKEAELLAVQQTSDNIVEDDDLTVSIDDFQTDVVVTDMGEYYTHHVTVTGLDPETEYSFMVGDKYLFREVEDVDGNTVVSTLQTPEQIKSPVPAYGTVKDANNQEDILIDELVPVTDGVMYFNYLDEFTGERSSVYSSSFNDSGNWYIDVSNAVGEDGEHFISRFEETTTNIFVELLIDAGPRGRFLKRVIFDNVSPTDWIVINDPLMINDAEFGVEKLSSKLNSELIKGVKAGSCKFMEFCGPCYKDVLTNSCSCPQATLEARGCNGESDSTLEDVREAANRRKQENKRSNTDSSKKCAGGGNPGDYLQFGNDCKKCQRNSTGSFYLWSTKGVDSKKCEGVSDGHVHTPKSDPSPSTSTNTSPYGEPCREDDNYFYYENSGGLCNIQIAKEEEITDDESTGSEDVTVEDPVQWCGPNNVGRSCERTLGNGVCSTTNKCVIPGSECSDGGLGKWNQEGECIPYTPDELCWTKRSRHTLYKGSGENRMRCSDGRWISDPVENGSENWCSLGDTCNRVQELCLASSGDYYICKVESWGGDKLIWKEYEGSEESIAIEVDQIGAGEECKEKRCKCVDGVDKGRTISVNEWCRESRLTLNNVGDSYNRICADKKEGAVCSRSGITCTWDNRPKARGEQFYCSGEKPESSSTNQNDDNLISFKDLTSQVLGREIENQFLIDKSTGMFTQIDQGTYIFEYQGESYAFDVGVVDTDGVLVYIDDNDNGKYDEGIDINVSEIASTINISTVEKTYRYNLKAGLNFISLPFLISYEDYRTAAGLLTKLNEVYDDAFYSISKFDGRWKIVGQNVDIYDNNDFQLLPGEGYMIKAKEDINISIVGQPVQLETDEDKSPIHMTQGWNLIGLYGSGIKSYTAKTLIEDINQDNFTADNVTKWAGDKQMYEGYQLSDGEEYGFDYPLNILESYFVRITEGKGNWQPELGGNN